jgi:O-antigen ligase
MIRHKIFTELFKNAKLINSETFFIGLSIVSLVYSLYFISVGLIGLTILSFFRGKWDNTIFFRNKWMLFPALIFLVSFLFGIGGDDTAFWLGRMRIHLPFLILPLVFLRLAPISLNTFIGFHLLLIGALVTVLAGSLVYYGLNFEMVQNGIQQGRSVPVPVNHIRLSLILVYGIFMTWWIRDQFKEWKTLLLLIMLFLILGLHYMAVRNGLLAFYLLFFVEAFRRVKLYAFIVFLVPVVFFFSIPSFKAKIGYSIYELKKTLSGEGSGYSTGDRVKSIQDGWILFKQNPWFGVGTADLKGEMSKLKEGNGKLIMPHNQWINVLAASGIFGLILFFTGYLAPLATPGMFRFMPAIWLYGILTLSMVFESILDTSDGVGFFLIFLLVSFNYLRHDFSNRR